VSAPAFAQLLADELPKELEGVGIVERLDQKIPLDLSFKDETGRTVVLSEYFKPGKPVILTINYYTCPMLCDETLKGMVNGLKDVEWSAGKEFTIVTVSMNPKEPSGLADLKKQAYLTLYERESAKDGWHFLIGDQANIDALCKATGFGYRYDATSGDYAHTATIMFLTPEAKLARYINNVVFEPRDLRFALIEASQGAIGSPMDKFLLYMCFKYDPDADSYAASALKIMRLGGIVTVILLAGGLSILWWRGSRVQAPPLEAGVAEVVQ
jgi:protein SCO1/2